MQMQPRIALNSSNVDYESKVTTTVLKRTFDNAGHTVETPVLSQSARRWAFWQVLHVCWFTGRSVNEDNIVDVDFTANNNPMLIETIMFSHVKITLIKKLQTHGIYTFVQLSVFLHHIPRFQFERSTQWTVSNWWKSVYMAYFINFHNYFSCLKIDTAVQGWLIFI